MHPFTILQLKDRSTTELVENLRAATSHVPKPTQLIKLSRSLADRENEEEILKDINLSNLDVAWVEQHLTILSDLLPRAFLYYAADFADLALHRLPPERSSIAMSLFQSNLTGCPYLKPNILVCIAQVFEHLARQAGVETEQQRELKSQWFRFCPRSLELLKTNPETKMSEWSLSLMKEAGIV